MIIIFFVFIYFNVHETDYICLHPLIVVIVVVVLLLGGDLRITIIAFIFCECTNWLNTSFSYSGILLSAHLNCFILGGKEVVTAKENWFRFCYQYFIKYPGTNILVLVTNYSNLCNSWFWLKYLKKTKKWNRKFHPSMTGVSNKLVEFKKNFWIKEINKKKSTTESPFSSGSWEILKVFWVLSSFSQCHQISLFQYYRQ